jgi:hypothetical protein
MKKLSALAGVACAMSIASSAVDAQAGSRPNELSSAERAAGWRLLFDGKTFAGWRGLGYDSVPTAHWRIVNGTIEKLASGNVPKSPDGHPTSGGDLMTVDTFKDFELAFQWKVTRRANSGVKYNVSEDFSLKNASNHAALGFEYQIEDDVDGDDIMPETHLTGALYDMFAANTAKRLNPIGEWNSSRVVLRGNHGEHWLNGAKVVEFDLGTSRTDSALAKSKYRSIKGFAERKMGHIVLQDHNDEVYFRDIKIRELKQP